MLSLVLNVLWLVLAGFWLAVGYALAGLLMCLLVITIPFGISAFRLAGYAFWPFGRVVVRRPGAGGGSLVGNVLWFLLAGIWLAIAHVTTAFALAVTVIGIPFAWANLKLAVLALSPLGRDVVDADDARARGSEVVGI